MASTGDRRPQPPRSGIRPRPEPGPDRHRPRRERGLDHDEDEDPRAGRLPGGRVEDGQTEHHEAGVLDDRVADDMLEVVLEPGPDRPER